jgi:3,4-dihydroxyphthalate decarboxylase
MSEIDDLKEQVAKSCRIVGRLHMTREPNGHVSARIPGTDRVLIKARGPGESALSYVEPGDIITVDLDGKKLDGREDQASPAEVYIHTWLYKTRPEVQSVIHIHPPAVVAFTIAGKPILPIVGAYNPGALRLVTDGLPLFPRSILINSEERGEQLAKTMGQALACLMRGHGITTAGRSVEESTLVAINLNDLAELHYRADLLGGARAIPDEDLEEFKNMSFGGGGERSGPRPPSSEWKYYERMLGGA